LTVLQWYCHEDTVSPKKYCNLTGDQNTRTMVSDMNDLYLVRKDSPFQMLDDVEPIGDGHYL
jgi:hypothetical protein